MATKRGKADPQPKSSEDETPFRVQRSPSPATGSGDAALVPPARQMDLDEQVARLNQQKIAEMLPPPPFTSKRKRHDFGMGRSVGPTGQLG